VSDVLMAELDGFVEGRGQGVMGQEGKRYVGHSSPISRGGNTGGGGGSSLGGGFFSAAGGSSGFGVSAPSPPGPLPGRSDSLSTSSSFGGISLPPRGGGGMLVDGEDIDLEASCGKSHFSDEGYGSWQGRRRAVGEFGRWLESPVLGAMEDCSPTSADGGCWNGMDQGY
jgi:hypothetical protein